MFYTQCYCGPSKLGETPEYHHNDMWSDGRGIERTGTQKQYTIYMAM